MAKDSADLPFLDLAAQGFSTSGADVIHARAAHWCAKTPYGFAVLRHRQAGLILRDRRFRQGSHDWPRKVGLTGAFAQFWRRSIISLEGPAHKTQRRAAQTALAEPFVKSLEAEFETIAKDLLASLPDAFDFIDDFSEPFAGRAVAAIFGLPQSQAAALAHDASTLGRAMGLDAKTHETQVNAATDRLMALAETLLAGAPPNSFVPRLQAAAQALGLHDKQILKDLIVISIFGGVDTTRAQLGFVARLFADAPKLWAQLRATPQAIPDAIAEAIRLCPTTTWATREAVQDVTLDGVTIRAGATVHIMVHASATDPLTGHDGQFNPFARRKHHFGFGGGAHACLGQLVARTDMACALRAMVQDIEELHWNGTPRYLPNSGNTSPVALPMRILRAG